MQLTLTRRTLSADEAMDWGIVAEVVDDDELSARAEGLAATLAAGPTTAFGHAKRLIRSSWETTPDQLGNDEADTIAALSEGPEAAALIDAFLQR